MPAFLNRVLFRATTGGTGTFTVSAAITGYMTPASSGAVNATVYSYFAESDDKSEWEIGTGTYTTSGTTLSRTVLKSSNANAAVDFTAAPRVSMTPLSADLLNPANNLSDVASAATAFGNIKQAATTSVTGVVELATDAETQALSDTSRAVTPSNLASLVATQANQETGTANDRFVTPGRQQYHPSAAKCWGYTSYSAGTPTLQASFNITSVTDTAVGQLTWTIGTDFSSANWSAQGSADHSNTAQVRAAQFSSRAAGSIIQNILNTGPALADPDTGVSFAGFGDQ